MAADLSSSPKASFIRKHPALTYFLLTFAISWAAAFLIAAPKLLRSAPLSQLTGILMFPAMLVGPSVAGIFLTRWLGGHEGSKSLFIRMRRVWFSPFFRT
jgi:uncharacterized protein